MKKAAALLDSLMGPSRNLADSEKSGEDFKKKDVCKPYLVGCCPPQMYQKKADPFGELTAEIGGGKALRACNKTHAKGLRAELASHPNAEKYKAEYERELMKKLSFIVEEAEDRAKKNRPKCRTAESVGARIPDVVRCELQNLADLQQQKQEEAEAKGNDGDIQGSKMAMDEALKAKERHDHLSKTAFRKEFPGESVCELCGIIYFNGKCMDEVRGGKITDQYEDEHFVGEQHKAFKAMIDRLECLKEKYKDVPPPEEDGQKEEKDDDRSRRRSRSRKGDDKKEKDDDRNRKRSRSPKGRRSRSRRRGRSDSRRRGRSRDRSRDRRRR